MIIYVYDLGRLRYLLGYGWANRASYCWLFLCLEYIYLKRFRINAAFLFLMVTVATVFIPFHTDKFSVYYYYLHFFVLSNKNDIQLFKKVCTMEKEFQRKIKIIYLFIYLSCINRFFASLFL